MAGRARTVDHDVIIAGGGMIGTSLSLALAPLGLDILVVEAVPRGKPQQPSFDERSTALSRSSQRSFEAMGLWPRIVRAATPIEHIHVSDRGRFGFSHIDAAEQGVEALGYVVINRVLGDVLQSAQAAHDNVSVRCPATIAGTEPAEDLVSVSIEEGGSARTATARVLVAADGARSSVREQLGIGSSHASYGQRAIIGNLLTSKPHGYVAYERFTEQGPLAMLPVTDERVAFVWTVEESAADELLALDDDAFMRALHDAFGRRLGNFSRIGRRASYPLTLSKALRLTAQRSVLVGNAAHGLHPAAAQGFNLGLRDVAALADCIADALDAGDDIGAAGVLDRYAAWRKSDQQKLVRFTDGLVRLFGSRRRLVRLARNAGMLTFDFVPGLRREFARHTMGLAGRLPRLSRGVPLR